MSDPITTEQEQQLPTNPEDRKTAAALSSLNNGVTADSNSNLPSTVDQEALGNAMSRLDIVAGQNTSTAEQANNKQTATAAATTTQATAAAETMKKKAAVKVAAEDVSLLVAELDLSKAKATELLKAHDGDARRAIKAFITVGA